MLSFKEPAFEEQKASSFSPPPLQTGKSFSDAKKMREKYFTLSARACV